MNSYKPLLIIAALFGGLSVAIGAFAAHGLKATLDSQALAWIQTGVQYQMFHSLAILVLAVAIKQWPHWPGLDKTAYSFIIGILLFCGSLYFMALTNIRALGIITPIGGLAFLTGWALLVWAAIRSDTGFGKHHDR